MSKLGDAAEASDTNIQATATVTCDPGWVATGGGFLPASTANFRVIESRPIGGPANPTGWQIVFTRNVSTGTTRTQGSVICMRA